MVHRRDLPLAGARALDETAFVRCRCTHHLHHCELCKREDRHWRVR